MKDPSIYVSCHEWSLTCMYSVLTIFLILYGLCHLIFVKLLPRFLSEQAEKLINWKRNLKMKDDDEGGDEGCGEGGDEGGKWLIFSCLRGFEEEWTD